MDRSGTFLLKKYFLENIKNFFKNAWIDLGHFYKKIFFATMKKFPVNYKNFFGTIKILKIYKFIKDN